jgi:hypothetical protein
VQQKPGCSLPQAPSGFTWRVQARFGLAVTLPRRFQLHADTVDPLARGLREVRFGDDPGAEPRDAPGVGRWPDGFWDPAVVAELDEGRAQPFRLLEFDVLWDDTMPLSNTAARELWSRAPSKVTGTLASMRLQGYELLGTREMRLGHLDGLGFNYRWDGLRTYGAGGDRALFVWAPSPWGVFHVYHHCPEMEWTARRPELEAILATFTALDAVPAGTGAGA